ncbi:MAG TPA: histidine kinase, partial [Casimicrobiaceae bacterium]|nr:histidine kinase [Casimicrobiaceae bacterium]
SFTTAVFDVCHVGVVLRAVLFVNAVVAVALLFAVNGWRAWLTMCATGAAVVLPSVLAWLLAACSLKHRLERAPLALQWVGAVGLGVLAGAFGWTLGAATGLELFDPRRWWASGVAGGALAAVVFQWLRMRAQARFPAETTARLAELQSRIRPHFLFNTLNTALSLVRLDPVRAEGLLEDLAELFRVLMRDNRDLTPLADEVQLCRQYLELEKLRLGERLVVDWNIKSMPPDALVPPLVLQPLLENAVYHGIEPSSSPGTLSINIFASRDEVHAILRNPHVVNARNHRGGNRMAIANVRERLALHFDAEASLDSRVTREQYEVHIRMPYRTTRPEQAEQPATLAQRATPPIRNDARKERSRALPGLNAGPCPT